MAGAVCHELNQPLQVVVTYSQLLMEDTSEDDVVQGKVEKIKAQTDRMRELTKKLMRITRYETMDYLFEGESIIDIDKAAAKGV